MLRPVTLSTPGTGRIRQMVAGTLEKEFYRIRLILPLVFFGFSNS